MTEFKLETLLFSLSIWFLVYANAAHKTSRDAPDIGYLYDRPAHALEEDVEDVEKPEEETKAEENNSTESFPQKRAPDEYSKPKAEFVHLKGKGISGEKILKALEQDLNGRGRKT